MHMVSLSLDEIELLWQEMSAMKREDAPQLIEMMKMSQPDTVTYLLASGEDLLNPEERELIFFMGVLIWRVVTTLRSDIPTINMSQLIESESKNITMLEYLDGEPDGDFFSTVETIMAGYNQSELLRYVMKRLVEESDASGKSNNDHVGIIVIFLKTFIDCLDVTD